MVYRCLAGGGGPGTSLIQLPVVDMALEEWFTGAWLAAVTRGTLILGRDPGHQSGQSPVVIGRAACGRQCGQISRIWRNV